MVVYFANTGMDFYRVIAFCLRFQENMLPHGQFFFQNRNLFLIGRPLSSSFTSLTLTAWIPASWVLASWTPASWTLASWTPASWTLASWTLASLWVAGLRVAGLRVAGLRVAGLRVAGLRVAVFFGCIFWYLVRGRMRGVTGSTAYTTRKNCYITFLSTLSCKRSSRSPPPWALR